MTRPCFLVVDREYSGSISTRKLVIESAKMNVITAYSSVEAIRTMERFPAVSGVVLDAGMNDMPCPELIAALKRINPSVPMIVVCSHIHEPCAGDHHLDSFDPVRLLRLIHGLQPEATASILAIDHLLHDKVLVPGPPHPGTGQAHSDYDSP